MPLIGLVTVLLLLIPVPSFAQDWIEYSNQQDFFSVNLPGQPKIKDITYKSEYAIDLPARVYTAEDGVGKYSVTVVDYTVAEKKHADAARSCKAAGGDGDLCNDRAATDLRGAIVYATWHLFQRNAKVTHLVYTQADRVEGHEVHLDNADGSRTFAAIYMHENRLYILEATGPGDLPPPLLFQQSMGFLDKTGKNIRYNSTYSNGFPPPPLAR